MKTCLELSTSSAIAPKRKSWDVEFVCKKSRASDACFKFVYCAISKILSWELKLTNLSKMRKSSKAHYAIKKTPIQIEVSTTNKINWMKNLRKFKHTFWPLINTNSLWKLYNLKLSNRTNWMKNVNIKSSTLLSFVS